MDHFVEFLRCSRTGFWGSWWAVSSGGWSRCRVLKAVTRSIGRGKASATVKGLMKANLTRRWLSGCTLCDLKGMDGVACVIVKVRSWSRNRKWCSMAKAKAWAKAVWKYLLVLGPEALRNMGKEEGKLWRCNRERSSWVWKKHVFFQKLCFWSAVDTRVRKKNTGSWGGQLCTPSSCFSASAWRSPAACWCLLFVI